NSAHIRRLRRGPPPRGDRLDATEPDVKRRSAAALGARRQGHAGQTWQEEICDVPGPALHGTGLRERKTPTARHVARQHHVARRRNTMPQTFLLGMNAKIYQGSAGTELASLTEMGNVKDVTLTLEAGEADVTTRSNQGWRATAPTLRECTAEFKMLWKPGDTGFEAIKNAFQTAGTIRLAVLAFGMIEDETPDWYSQEVLAGIDQDALEHGICIELMGSHTADMSVLAQRLSQSRPDALLVMPSTCRHALVVGEAQRLDIPCILTGTRLLDLGLPTVCEDGAQGAALAVRHLYERGHRRIGLVQRADAAP